MVTTAHLAGTGAEALLRLGSAPEAESGLGSWLEVESALETGTGSDRRGSGSGARGAGREKTSGKSTMGESTSRGDLQEREVKRASATMAAPTTVAAAVELGFGGFQTRAPLPPQPPKERLNGRVGRHCSSHRDKNGTCDIGSVCWTVLQRPSSRRHTTESDEHTCIHATGEEPSGRRED
jgi:hypothetical protein